MQECVIEWWKCVDWIDLAQDRNSWRAVVNTAISSRVPSNAGIYLTSAGTFRFQKKSLQHVVCLFVCLFVFVSSRMECVIEYMLKELSFTVQLGNAPPSVPARRFGVGGVKTPVLHCESCANDGVLEITLCKMIGSTFLRNVGTNVTSCAV
jgi:hypothetical protein